MNREQIIEAMARAVRESKHSNTWGVALDALCDATPGLADVIAGKAVVVPVEATEGMKQAFQWGSVLPGEIAASTNAAVYRAMIEARPK